MTDTTTTKPWIDVVACAGIVIMASFGVSVALERLIDKWFANEQDYPIGVTLGYHPFGLPIEIPCHMSATGIFLLLTGIARGGTDLFGNRQGTCHFDPELDEPRDKVYYYGVSWSKTPHTHNHDFHAMVYHDGYLYQSFRTRRFSWLPFMDAYPLIRVQLEPRDREIFEQRNITRESFNLPVDVFNRLCAPSSHQIPKDAQLTCVDLYTARVCPARRSVTLTRDETPRY